MSIQAHADLRSYFRQRFTDVQARAGFKADSFTEHYLVELLARAATGDADATSEEPLALAVAGAAEAGDPRERFQRFRAAGDKALFRCGLFPEILRRLGVKRSYAVAMGSRAYAHAGALAHYSAEPFRQVYPILGKNFDKISQILLDVMERPAPKRPQDVIRLYTEWRTTGCERLAGLLIKAGVSVPTDNGKPN